MHVGELESRKRETAALSDVLVAKINKASPVPTTGVNRNRRLLGGALGP